MKMNMKRKMKKNKGITLIALIITIIVMLILATLTITSVINGGLFSYAKRAKVESDETEIKEKVHTAYLLATGKSKSGLTEEIYEEELDNALGKNTYELYEDENAYEWVVVVNASST